jgi:hypothetical protein
MAYQNMTPMCFGPLRSAAAQQEFSPQSIKQYTDLPEPATQRRNRIAEAMMVALVTRGAKGFTMHEYAEWAFNYADAFIARAGK